MTPPEMQAANTAAAQQQRNAYSAQAAYGQDINRPEMAAQMQNSYRSLYGDPPTYGPWERTPWYVRVLYPSKKWRRQKFRYHYFGESSLYQYATTAERVLTMLHEADTPRKVAA